MQYRQFGGTGRMVSALGFGCMRLPVIDGNKAAIDKKKASDLLYAAEELGVNYLDTAYGYHEQMSERFLGEALAGGLRKSFLLATKLPSWLVHTREDMDRILNEQLARLGTDYLDFYLLHSLKLEWWDKLVQLGVLEFLDQARRQGKILFTGFSFHDESIVFKKIVDAFDWSMCQIQYNFLDTEIQAGREGLLYAAEKGLGVAVMEPLRGGNLAASPPGEIASLWESSPVKRSPAGWSLSWLWNQPQVGVVLSGMNSIAQLEENCRTADLSPAGCLSPMELNLVEQVREKYRERIKIPCTGCGYCMPCPQGVNIPRIFSILNDLYIHDDRLWAYGIYNNATNSGERASNCVECGECEEACPQNITIRRALKESDEILGEPI